MLSFLKARAAPAPSAAGGAQRHIVLTAPGRSGSTLLQSFFLADCEAVTFFEPCRFTPERSPRSWGHHTGRPRALIRGPAAT